MQRNFRARKFSNTPKAAAGRKSIATLRPTIRELTKLNALARSAANPAA
jgi:hypothetical protein